MPTGRLEAFSDGVLAILITIMVLELHIPHGTGIAALRPLVPVALSYLLSFVYLGIYWNNHHHMLQLTERVNGRILWANLHLLFWLSLVPFTSGWMGENHFAQAPIAIYGIVLLAAGIAYYVLKTVIVAEHGHQSTLAIAFGRDLKGKLSVVMYAVAVLLSLASRWVALAIYVAVALIWVVPDRRLESTVRAATGREGS